MRQNKHKARRRCIPSHPMHQKPTRDMTLVYTNPARPSQGNEEQQRFADADIHAFTAVQDKKFRGDPKNPPTTPPLPPAHTWYCRIKRPDLLPLLLPRVLLLGEAGRWYRRTRPSLRHLRSNSIIARSKHMYIQRGSPHKPFFPIIIIIDRCWIRRHE